MISTILFFTLFLVLFSNWSLSPKACATFFIWALVVCSLLAVYGTTQYIEVGKQAYNRVGRTSIRNYSKYIAEENARINNTATQYNSYNGSSSYSSSSSRSHYSGGLSGGK